MAPRLPAPADHRSLEAAAEDPVISGVNEAGMLPQSQDIGVRAAELRLRERALRKVVGGCWLPIAEQRVTIPALPASESSLECVSLPEIINYLHRS